MFTYILRRIHVFITGGIALFGCISMFGVLQTLQSQETKDIAPPHVAPPDKPYEQTVAATGILEALSENVSIGVPVPGLVTEVAVKVNDFVKEGQPLFKLDDRELRAALIKQRAAVDVGAANLEVAKATLVKTQDMLDRMMNVTDARAISQDDLKNRKNDVMVAKAQAQASEALLRSAVADVKQSEVLVERLTVAAPRDGVILQVNIRAGEYASTQPKVPSMVLGDLEKLQVRADVDEQNAVRIMKGQAAKAFVKGDSVTAIPLSFVRIEPYVIPKVSLTGASTERVDTRVLQVIYSLQRPKEKPLYVGQQVDVYIDASLAKPSP